MAKKDPGLHKDIASIFQGLSAEKDKQQDSSAHNKSQEQNDIFTELLTPSHLTSETNTPQQQKTQQTEQQNTEQQVQSPQEHLEDTTHEPGSEETSESVPETAIQEQTQTVDQTTKKTEIMHTKVVAAKTVEKLSGIRKIVQQLQDKLLSPKPGVDPKRQKIMLVLIPVLVIVMIVVLTQVFKSPAKNTNPAAISNTTAGIETSKEIIWQMPEPYPANLRDPMQAGSVSTSRVNYDNIVVKGILYSQDNPAALIAEEIVHQGDQIFGATVIKINKDNVEFERDGQTWTQTVQR
jgi:hypothetical protein